MQVELKASSLIPFLEEKNKVQLKYNKEAVIERKESIIDKVESINEEEGTVWCTITSQNIDRVGDIVVSSGIDTSEFQKINSVFINHNYAELPVAKCNELVHKDGYIMAKIQFALGSPVVKDIFERVKAGVVRGISVGFDASEVILRGCKEFDEICKSMKLTAEDYIKVRRVIPKWKLYEFSIVGMPANPDCTTKQLEVKADEAEEEEVVEKVESKEEPKEEVEEDKWKAFSEKGRANEKGITVKEVDPEQLAMGRKVEMEHTDDEEIAERIALDHLAEYPNYYSLLKRMEEEADEAEEEENEDEEAEEKSIKKSIVVIKQPEPVRYINVLRTEEDNQNIINKTVEARLKGKTRLQITLI